MKLFGLIALCVLLCGGCDFLSYPGYIVTPEPSGEPEPIILPEPAPRVLTFGVPFSSSDNYSPLRDMSRYNEHTLRLCYEGLVELDRYFVPRPLLCVSVETTNNIHFTIRLRDDIVFHDGSPLTAADVIYSFAEARRAGGPYSARLSKVSAVSAQEENTVLVSMNTTVWNAAALFDFPIIRESGEGAPYGTGPYRIVFSPDGNYLRLSENWRGETPSAPARIELVETATPDTLIYSFQYGYISMMPHDARGILSPGIHTGYDKTVTPSTIMQYIGINSKKRLLDRKDFRRVLALAVDRQGAVSSVYGDDATAAVLPMPPSSHFYSESSARNHIFDVIESAHLLAGFNSVPELSFIVGAEDSDKVQMAEEISLTLRSVGFSVNVRPLKPSAFESALASGDYDLYYAEARLAPNLDPREVLLPGAAFSYGVSESYSLRSALYALSSSDPYSAEGESKLETVWNVFYDETPVITVCFRDTYLISQRGLLSGQTPTFFNSFRGFEGWRVSGDGIR
jgi:peptide/nickel transport system substrate-binding protein